MAGFRKITQHQLDQILILHKLWLNKKSVLIKLWLESESRADFSNMDWECMIFQTQNLDHANFEGSKLCDAIFVGSYLNCANFERADLTRSSFEGASLEGATFQMARLNFANFKDAKLKGAYFEDADLTGADLSDITKEKFLDLVNINENTILTGVKFKEEYKKEWKPLRDFKKFEEANLNTKNGSIKINLTYTPTTEYFECLNYKIYIVQKTFGKDGNLSTTFDAILEFSNDENWQINGIESRYKRNK